MKNWKGQTYIVKFILLEAVNGIILKSPWVLKFPTVISRSIKTFKSMSHLIIKLSFDNYLFYLFSSKIFFVWKTLNIECIYLFTCIACNCWWYKAGKWQIHYIIQFSNFKRAMSEVHLWFLHLVLFIFYSLNFAFFIFFYLYFCIN